jgi:hypothetical protein
MKRLLSLLPLIVAVALPFMPVQACGPDFFPDLFVRDLRPDHPRDFAAGKLGVIQATYPRLDLTVAYRYLNGSALTAAEQAAYTPTDSYVDEEREIAAEDAKVSANSPEYAEPPGPADQWLKARAEYAPPMPELHPVREYDTIYTEGYFLAGQYENCQADGFRTAIATLNSRAKTWGGHSAELADWIKGQDAVFSNCSSGADASYGPRGTIILPSSPAAAAANAPALLRQDRAYQIAATEFYAGQFDAARASFQAIAQDAGSPWRGVARYLVARSLIREAFLSAKDGPDDVMATYNPDLMKQAQQQLESMRAENLPGISPHSVQSMLNLVRLRTEPQARLRELSAALAGPNADANYAQDIDDLNWYLNGKLDSLAIREDTGDYAFHIAKADNDYSPDTFEQKLPGFDKAFNDAAELRSDSPLIDWLVTFQSPADLAKKHAFAEWKRTGSVPWFVVAIMKASASDSETTDLIEAAGKIRPASPAWLIVTYNRERLLIEMGKSEEVTTEISAVMPAIERMGSVSAVNLFTGLRMRAAKDFDDALANAPRKIIERTSEEQAALDECLDVMKNPKRKYDCKKDNSPVEFSEDAAAVFNSEMPLAALAQSAQSGALPPNLRQSVAMMTWVRSVLLKNDAIAAKMFPLLPQELQQQAGPGVGFHPLMAILRNPGLRPYLDGGVQRSDSYDFVESYSDNWWCGDWTTSYSEGRAPVGSQSVAFLSPQAREAGAKETALVFGLGSGEDYLGSQAVEYARAHPSDPNVPEALYLTLRAIRYGCYREADSNADSNVDRGKSDRTAKIALEVGALMRQRYPANPWTKKAAPFVWPVEKSK